MVEKTLFKDIPLKSGNVLKKGTKVTVKSIPGNDRACKINDGNRDYQLRYTSEKSVSERDDCPVLREVREGVLQVSEGMEIKNIKITFQRNGVQGEPFHAVSFTHEHEQLFATVTDTKGGCHVINPDNFGMAYRGDNFERVLREAIITWYSREYKVDLVRAREELNDGLTEKVY